MKKEQHPTSEFVLIERRTPDLVSIYNRELRYVIFAVYLYIKISKMSYFDYSTVLLPKLYEALGRAKNHSTFYAIKKALEEILENDDFGTELVYPSNLSDLSLNGCVQFKVAEPSCKFFKLYKEELDKLFNSTYKTKAHLIYVFCTIISKFYGRNKNDSPKQFPEAWSGSYLMLSDMTGLSLATLVNIVKELQDLKLICCKVPDTERLGKDYFIRIPTIYARYGHNEELEYKYNQLASKFYKGCKKKSSKKKNVQNASVTPGQSDGNSNDDWDDAWGTEAATDEWDDGYLE